MEVLKNFITEAFGDIALTHFVCEGIKLCLVSPDGDSKCFISAGLSNKKMPAEDPGRARAEIMLSATGELCCDLKVLEEVSRVLEYASSLPFERKRAFEMGEVIKAPREFFLAWGYESLLVFPVMQMRDKGEPINFFVLIPLYASEAQWIEELGWESFVPLYNMSVDERELFCFDVKRAPIDPGLEMPESHGSCDERD